MLSMKIRNSLHLRRKSQINSLDKCRHNILRLNRQIKNWKRKKKPLIRKWKRWQELPIPFRTNGANGDKILAQIKKINKSRRNGSEE